LIIEPTTPSLLFSSNVNRACTAYSLTFKSLGTKYFPWVYGNYPGHYPDGTSPPRGLSPMVSSLPFPSSNNQAVHPKRIAISYWDFKLCIQSYPPWETLSAAYG